MSVRGGSVPGLSVQPRHQQLASQEAGYVGACASSVSVWSHSPWLVFLITRHLYDLCQMFPESASESITFVLRDAMHEMEGTIEAKGRAAFPGLDVVSRGLP